MKKERDADSSQSIALQGSDALACRAVQWPMSSPEQLTFVLGRRLRPISFMLDVVHRL
jgi:hypothetical protein